MKKKILFLIAGAMIGLAANAQQQPKTWKFTPKIGITCSNFRVNCLLS